MPDTTNHGRCQCGELDYLIYHDGRWYCPECWPASDADYQPTE